MQLAGRLGADILNREAKSAHESLAYSLINPTFLLQHKQCLVLTFIFV